MGQKHRHHLGNLLKMNHLRYHPDLLILKDAEVVHMHIKVCTGMVEGSRVNGVGSGSCISCRDDMVYRPMILSMVTNQENNWGDVLRISRV